MANRTFLMAAIALATVTIGSDVAVRPAVAGEDPYGQIRRRYECVSTPARTITRRVCSSNGVCRTVTTTTQPGRTCYRQSR